MPPRCATSLHFDNVEVGQTVSHDMLLAGGELELAGTISIDAEASIDGEKDVYPADNARSISVVHASTDSDPR